MTLANYPWLNASGIISVASRRGPSTSPARVLSSDAHVSRISGTQLRGIAAVTIVLAEAPR